MLNNSSYPLSSQIWPSAEMELYIETLTGAAFELRVSPFETIMSVKAKIQRLEGMTNFESNVFAYFLLAICI